MVKLEPTSTMEGKSLHSCLVGCDARVALGGMSREEAEVRPTSALDVQKFDMGSVYESDPATRVN